MALLSLDIQDRPPRSPSEVGRFSPLRLSFPLVDRGLLPGRGLAFSFFTHLLIIGGVLFGPIYLGMTTPSQARRLEPEDTAESHVIYLPRLGGGGEGNGFAGGGSIVKRKGVTTTPASSSQGISFPGPQAILSDPPNPTNRFQTLMRPALKNPPILRTFVAVPNIVQTTNAGPLPMDSAAPIIPKPQPTALKAPVLVKRPEQNAQAPTITAVTTEVPKLALPTSGPQAPAAPTQEMSAPRARALRVDALKAPQYSPVPTSGPDAQNLVSLSPNPGPPVQSAALPVGEARGRFAISPDASSATAAVEAGSKLPSSASLGASIGSDPEAPLENAASQGQSGVSNGAERLAIGGTGGTGANTGNSIGNGSGGNGTDKGRGSAAGLGLGSGAGVSPGAGSGAGVAPGAGAFPGITIEGSGAKSDFDAKFAPQMVFSVPAAVVLKLRRNPLVVSAGATGGGGLDAYGALKCGRIYTIFLPMPGANWTMQYCQRAGSTSTPPTDPKSTVVHIQPPIIPPDPDSDSQFDFQRLPVPPEKARKLIMLKGILREDGTIDGLEVYQGVVPQMDEAARLAFSRWKFKPAKQEGKPVTVQILIGIPPEVAPNHQPEVTPNHQ